GDRLLQRRRARCGDPAAGARGMSGALTLLPALDIAGGRASQVVGDSDTEPERVAAGWVAGGARWLHLVDLDRAFGRGDNAALLADLVAAQPVPVQLSGGIDDDSALGVALATDA